LQQSTPLRHKSRDVARLKLDEGLSIHLRQTLEARGHNVDTVVDEGLGAANDATIAAAARQHDRMLFCLDVGFGDIRHYVPGEHPGIVLFRLGHAGPGSVSQVVERFVIEHDLDKLVGCLVIVEPGNVRLRCP
jgi:predicted nuclease of predicted toxin-antitoxin system